MTKHIKDSSKFTASTDLIIKIYDTDFNNPNYFEEIEDVTKNLGLITLEFLYSELLENIYLDVTNLERPKIGCKLAKLFGYYLNKKEKEHNDILPSIFYRVYQLLILHKYIYTQHVCYKNSTGETFVETIYLTQKGLDKMDPLAE